MKFVCTKADKLCIFPMVQQFVGACTVASNVIKIIKDLYRIATNYTAKMDKEIVEINNIINKLNVNDYYYLMSHIRFIHNNLRGKHHEVNFVFCKTFSELDSEDEVLLKIFGDRVRPEVLPENNIKALKNIKHTDYESDKNLWDYFFNKEWSNLEVYVKCQYGDVVKISSDKKNNVVVKDLIDERLLKDMVALKKACEFCELDKPKLLRHIAYVIIGIIRMIPGVGSVYSAVIWSTQKDAKKVDSIHYQSVFDKSPKHFKGTKFYKYQGNPLDTYY